MTEITLVDWIIWGLLAVYWLPKLRQLSPALSQIVDNGEDGLSPVEEVHQQYLDNEIDEAELEARLAVLVDDRATTIRDMTDAVDGIGEELSRDLAREFDSVADLHAADADDLQQVDGIGEKRAETLVEEL
ncbi:helix-hairpin-helix domain-containing protein [Haloarcula amylovorans]|uniref:helix-hairpin-helix domain-containing protein n=1 Tax=Haloarcula amylovorans TaxID=2562280 RepID=UPI001075FF55|nr:helix-hairpin-helix domain-containing protein [Halomicroarcula amylolytica]